MTEEALTELSEYLQAACEAQGLPQEEVSVRRERIARQLRRLQEFHLERGLEVGVGIWATVGFWDSL